MSGDEYEVIASGFERTADIPKDDDILYRCTNCGSAIPSVPDDNIGCKCGNVFIDKDYWRLIVVDLTKLEAVRAKGAGHVYVPRSGLQRDSQGLVASGRKSKRII